MTEALSLLESSRNQIFERWEDLTRERVAAAKNADAMALRDHLPVIYEEILEACRAIKQEGCRGRKAAARFVGHPAHEQHGKLRASTKGYTIESLIREYYILEEVVLDFLDEHSLWDRGIAETIHYLIQHSITATADVFSESIELMQQRMLGTLVHDIRTPLTAATMAGELLAQDGTDEDTKLQLSHMSRDGVARALEMLTGLLDTVMAEAGDGLIMDFQKGSFSESFASAMEEAKAVYGKQLTWDPPAQDLTGIFDESAFRRILENLISNAVRYGCPKSPITVALEEQENSILLTVHNTGNPISQDRRERIFDFFSAREGNTAEVKNSWGLGLSFIRLAVDGHGGSVNLSSDEGSGTIFEVKLPKEVHAEGKVRTRLIEPKRS